MTLLGDAGIKRLAALNHETACDLSDKIGAISGAEVLNETFFNEFTVKLSKPAADVIEALAARHILGGVPVSRLTGDQEDLLLVCATETSTQEDIDAFVTALSEELS